MGICSVIQFRNHLNGVFLSSLFVRGVCKEIPLELQFVSESVGRGGGALCTVSGIMENVLALEQCIT